MKKLFSLVLVCAMLLVALPVTASADKSVFTDVSDSDYYATAVEWAVNWGVTNGTSATTFSPDEICTRAQVLTFLWRAHGEPEPKSSWNPFTDVPKGSYYDRATLWAVEQGIATGTSEYPKLFSPDKPCTNAEILTFIWRAKGSQAPEFPSPLTSSWPDLYYKDAVTWADNNAMLEDEGEVFDANRLCTRGHTMAWLWREAQVYVSTPEDLIKAIVPGHEIHLDPGTYNLSDWVNTFDLEGEYVETGNPYVKLSWVNDGYEVVIHDVRNLTIDAGKPVRGKTEIVVEPRYANVLTFENCDNIRLSDLTVGHTPDAGYCTGGVLCFRDCGNAWISGMDLYGCGTYGIIAERVANIQALNSVIRDCTYGLLDFTQVGSAAFGYVKFRDCSGFDMLILRSSSAYFESCEFRDLSWSEKYSHFISIDENSSAFFRTCSIAKKAYDDLTSDRLADRYVALEGSSVF